MVLAEAIAELKKDGAIPKELEHRQVKYLNNRIEGDHGKLKRLIRPTLGFQSMRTARATIKGFEVMRMFKKGQFAPHLPGRIRLTVIFEDGGGRGSGVECC